jgi:hypothetical protein
VQVDVLARSQGYVTPAPEVVDEMAYYGRQGVVEIPDHIDLTWSAVLRLLDQKDPSYRN